MGAIINPSSIIFEPSPSLITPPPGAYPDAFDPDYREWDALNNTTLSRLYEWSPEHVEYMRINPPEMTDALRIGIGVHSYVLESDKFAERCLVSDQCAAALAKGGQCKNSGKYRVKGEWYCGVHAKAGEDMRGKIVLTADEVENIKGMRESLMRNRAAREVIEAEGLNECAIRWDDDIDGPLPCKGKIDMIRPTWEATVDLKTTECARQVDFEKSLTEFGYYRQGAFYLDGLNRTPCEHRAERHILIAVEKKPPYGVGTFVLQKDAMDAGREEIQALKKLYANCKRNNHWPSYSDEFADISITQWKMREIFRSY